MEIAPFITIHGIDGTGKSSSVKGVVNELRQQGRQAESFDNLPKSKDIALTNPHPYKGIAKKQRQSLMLADWSNQGITVVKDRWLIDVLADKACHNDGEPLTVATYDITVPDLSVLLICAEDERQQRIADRGNPTPDDLVPNLPGYRAYQFESFLHTHLGNLSRHHEVLDTTHLSETETILAITGMVEQL